MRHIRRLRKLITVKSEQITFYLVKRFYCLFIRFEFSFFFFAPISDYLVFGSNCSNLTLSWLSGSIQKSGFVNDVFWRWFETRALAEPNRILENFDERSGSPLLISRTHFFLSKGLVLAVARKGLNLYKRVLSQLTWFIMIRSLKCQCHQWSVSFQIATSE